MHNAGFGVAVLRGLTVVWKGCGMNRCEVDEDWQKCWRQSCKHERACIRKAACAPADRPQDPMSAKAIAASLTFCYGKEASDAWNDNFPDKPNE